MSALILCPLRSRFYSLWSVFFFFLPDTAFLSPCSLTFGKINLILAIVYLSYYYGIAKLSAVSQKVLMKKCVTSFIFSSTYVVFKTTRGNLLARCVVLVLGGNGGTNCISPTKITAQSIVTYFVKRSSSWNHAGSTSINTVIIVSYCHYCTFIYQNTDLWF